MRPIICLKLWKTNKIYYLVLNVFKCSFIRNRDRSQYMSNDSVSILFYLKNKRSGFRGQDIWIFLLCILNFGAIFASSQRPVAWQITTNTVTKFGDFFWSPRLSFSGKIAETFWQPFGRFISGRNFYATKQFWAVKIGKSFKFGSFEGFLSWHFGHYDNINQWRHRKNKSKVFSLEKIH